MVSGEPKSLFRAFKVIFDNAIKFSPDGGVVAVIVGLNEINAWVQIRDHGVGIPPDAQGRIFNRFFHLDEVNGHLFRGVGIGLSIAKQVVEQHQGWIEVESEVGKGSQFTVYLPKKRSNSHI